MQHTLVIELGEDIYEPLAKTASQEGKTPEEVAASWLATAALNCSDDPIEKFIGSLKSGVPDWADRHDSYRGDDLSQNKLDQQRRQG